MATGMVLQPDAIVGEFTRCWGYLGQLGSMAKDMVSVMQGPNIIKESDVQQKMVQQLTRIVNIVEKTAEIDLEDKKTKSKKCNFYNRGFCKQGSSCQYVHPQEVCERHEHGENCGDRNCNKRHLYSCKHFNSEPGCTRGETCAFSHKTGSKVKEDLGRCATALGEDENHIADEEIVVDESEKEKDELLPSQQQIQENCETVNLEAAIEEKDLYEELIEAIQEGNSELQEEMMDKILETFENISENVRVEGNKKLKGKKVGLKNSRKKGWAVRRGKGM